MGRAPAAGGDVDDVSEGVTFRARRLEVSTAQELVELVSGQARESLLDSDGLDPQRDNGARAGWAARGLAAYAVHLGGATLTEEISVAAGDLLADLRHLFDALGLDWDGALESAEVHYRAEIVGEL